MPGCTPEERIARLPQFRVKLAEQLRQVTGGSGLSPMLSQLYTFLRAQPYFVDADKPVHYVSNSNAPMYFDIFLLSKHERELLQFAGLFAERPGNIAIMPGETNEERRRQIIRQAEKEVLYLVNKTANAHVPRDRSHLGQSLAAVDRARVRRDTITREDALALMNQGCTYAEIVKCYKVTEGTLRAWRAHQTMGTYARQLEAAKGR